MHLRAISQELMTVIRNMYPKITHIKLLPHLLEASGFLFDDEGDISGFVKLSRIWWLLDGTKPLPMLTYYH